MIHLGTIKKTIINGSLDKLPTNIQSLRPFYDENTRIIRIQGRLKDCGSVESPYQIFLHKQSKFATKVIYDYHSFNYCAGIKYIIYHSRLIYWIQSIWSIINKVLDTCPDCIKRRAEQKTPAPAATGLQPYRFQLVQRTFYHAFIDIMGPISTKDNIWINTIGEKQTASNHPIVQKSKRNNVTSTKVPYEIKRFVLTATCTQTRLFNMEILDGKNTSDVLTGLKRFFARRGVPSYITSDVSTEFVRSSKELDLLWKNLNKKEIFEFAIANAIDWNFGFPHCPNRQGLIERLHKPVKTALRTKFIKAPTYCELNTHLTQLESYINMRPLGFVRSSDSNSYETITPIELDKGIKCTFLPEYKTKQNYHVDKLVTSKDIAKRRKLLEISLTRAWNNWLKSYITDQNNIKSSNGFVSRAPRVGDVVLLNSLELGFSRGTYVTGIVKAISVFPNSDNVRSVKYNIVRMV